MKTLSRLILLTLLTLAFTGCEIEGNFSPTLNSAQDGSETLEVTIYGVKSEELTSTSPSSILYVKDYTLVGFYSPDHPELETIVLFHEGSSSCMLLSITKDSFIWYEMDPVTGTPSNQVMVATPQTLMVGTMDWTTGQMQSDAQIVSLSSLRQAIQPRDRQDQEDEKMFKELIIKDIIDPLIQYANKTSNILSLSFFLPEGFDLPGFDFIPQILEVTKMRIEESMVFDEMELNEVREQHRREFNVNMIFRTMTVPLSTAVSAFQLGYEHATGKELETDEEVAYCSDMFSRGSFNSQSAIVWEELPQSQDFELSISEAYDIERTSAKINGSYRYTGYGGANIVQKGVILTRPGSNDRKVFTASTEGDNWSLTLSDLEEATTYHAQSFLTSTRGTYYSGRTVSFTTKGLKLSLSPSSVEFPVKGGSRGIYVETTENAQWEVTSKPSWCSIQRDNAQYSFFIDAKKSSLQEPRHGTVTVRATITYPDGTQESLEQSVAVSQEGNNEVIPNSSFSNTQWSITGTMTTTMYDSDAGTHIQTENINDVFTFGEVTQESFSFQEGFWDTFFQENGNFALKSNTGTELSLIYTNNVAGIPMQGELTFTRVSTTSMKGHMDVSWYLNGNGFTTSCSMNFDFTGILIR